MLNRYRVIGFACGIAIYCVIAAIWNRESPKPDPVITQLDGYQTPDVDLERYAMRLNYKMTLVERAARIADRIESMPEQDRASARAWFEGREYVITSGLREALQQIEKERTGKK